MFLAQLLLDVVELLTSIMATIALKNILLVIFKEESRILNPESRTGNKYNFVP